MAKMKPIRKNVVAQPEKKKFPLRQALVVIGTLFIAITFILPYFAR